MSSAGRRSARRQAHRAALRVFRALPRRLRVASVHVLAPQFTVGSVGVVERDDGALLLVRHAYRRAWGLPGGLLTRGEAPADALGREAREEVGVDVVAIGEPAVVVDPRPRRVDVVFRARLVHPADASRVKPSSPEIIDVAWFPADQLPDLQPETTGALVALARQAQTWAAPNAWRDGGPVRRGRDGRGSTS